MKNYRLIRFALLISILTIVSCDFSNSQRDGWDKLDEIRKNIIPPTFQDKDFNIVDFGAVADGKTDCTEAFRKAISACNEAGGGRVVVPEGEFFTGAIHLKSIVNLYLSKNSVIKFSTNPQDYLPLVFTRWEGVECMNYSPLIYAYEQENIAVTGSGIIDGQGANDNWWPWKGNKVDGWIEGTPHQKKGRDLLFQMAEDNVHPQERIMGEGFYLRPSFFQPYKSKNILVDGVTFKNSPMWFLNPVLCENVTVKNLKIEGLGPNNDGCNPESSKNVLIQNCYFDTGDDCIAIKSGRNNDGRRINVPSENIIIEDCNMKEGHGGVVMGSEISGGVRNVFAQNCEMSSPNLDRALRFKTNAVRGGTIENIYFRNIKVGEVSEAVIKIDYYYEEGKKGNFLPTIRNVHVQNLTSEKSKFAIWIKAFDNAPVTGLYLDNCNFNQVAKDNVIEHVKDYKFNSVMINNKIISE
ncbi:MAG: glycoside hydrolase family 28 protein [Ignavibacteria bacterium]|nr:glycoside hydrolase family 28 protein [Ignavibacteria bacterium]